jgi:SSS family solute:Na+ symporter
MADRVPEALRAVGHRGWTAMPGLGTPLWWQMVSTIILGVGIGVLAQPQLTVRFMTVKSGRELNRALLPGGLFMVLIPGGAYLVGALSNVYFAGQTGKTALELVADPATGRPNVDKIMPLFVADAMPDWFAYLFMLALLAAAMSTLSAQFHAIGTAIGRDLYEQALSGGRDTRRTLPLARAGVLVGFALTVLVAFRLGPGIIAIATALFFGACAAAFLPAFVAALFWPRATRAGALAGMVTGVVAWGLWVLLVHERESAALGLARALSGRGSLLAGTSWAVVDPIVVALPLSALVTGVVSLAGRPDAPAPVRTA